MVISASFILCPDAMNIEESLVLRWFACAVYVDGATVLWLMRICLGERDVAVLLVAQGDEVSRGC